MPPAGSGAGSRSQPRAGAVEPARPLPPGRPGPVAMGGATPFRVLGPRRLDRADRGLSDPSPADADLSEGSVGAPPANQGVPCGESSPAAPRAGEPPGARPAATSGIRGPGDIRVAVERSTPSRAARSRTFCPSSSARTASIRYWARVIDAPAVASDRRASPIAESATAVMMPP